MEVFGYAGCIRLISSLHGPQTSAMHRLHFVLVLRHGPLFGMWRDHIGETTLGVSPAGLPLQASSSAKMQAAVKAWQTCSVRSSRSTPSLSLSMRDLADLCSIARSSMLVSCSFRNPQLHSGTRFKMGELSNDILAGELFLENPLKCILLLCLPTQHITANGSRPNLAADCTSRAYTSGTTVPKHAFAQKTSSHAETNPVHHSSTNFQGHDYTRPLHHE